MNKPATLVGTANSLSAFQSPVVVAALHHKDKLVLGGVGAGGVLIVPAQDMYEKCRGKSSSE